MTDDIQRAAEAAASAPGRPAPVPPSLAEPTVPQDPAPPKPDQRAPEYRSPTGVHIDAPPTARSQGEARLTTAQGTRLPDSDHSLKAGERGPILIRDHHLREKITHFDHERIPERVVHARGAGAHGVFRSYGTAAPYTRAAFLAESVEKPVFVRFSTVLGSRGSADTVRDTRGFATKFYTSDGTFDLVGNNMPVFFIQDAIKFPDVVHAAKPHPDREIPQAQSAHDTFWDFVSLHTEAQHHTMWNMSDRGIPRSYRMMEGFGVHTFRLVAADGTTTLVKWHWKPLAGVHSLVWEEAQMISGMDPDFHRRDLADAIEAGAFPQWELSLQVFEDTLEQTFNGIDLLDPTKIVPEEQAPVQPVGVMTLNANPTNYFAETEQVAFHVGHLVPGIDVTDDPLLAGRLFSYLDTQITRLGGPNFSQLPINRPHADVNDMLRDGMHQTAVHTGVAPYRPNSLDGGCPFTADAAARGYVEVAQELPATRKIRAAPASFSEHFGQPRQFYKSLTPVEQQHVVEAYTFELGRCYEVAVRERQLLALAEIDVELCSAVAVGLGLQAPHSSGTLPEVEPSPALSQVGGEWPVEARVVGILVGEDSNPSVVAIAVAAAMSKAMTPLVIADTGGQLGRGAGAVTVQRTLATGRSVELDALIVADGRTSTPKTDLLIGETFRHCKAIGMWGSGTAVVDHAGVPGDADGLVVADDPSEVITQVAKLLTRHRVWTRSV